MQNAETSEQDVIAPGAMASGVPRTATGLTRDKKEK
jgi:hypothetical protein